MSKPRRKSLSKKLRFEVFKRDSFTCQYCGGKAPDVLLHVDHIEPVSKGGDDDILNLITSCKACNLGKGARRLSDTTVMDKRHEQLEELQERKEQLEMMFDWQSALTDLDEHALDLLVEHWTRRVPGWGVNAAGRAELRRLANRFEYDELIEAINVAADSYLEYDDEGGVIGPSAQNAWSKVGGIAYNRRLSKTDPVGARLNYIRGIMRRSYRYVNERWARELLDTAASYGADVDELEQIAKSNRNWSAWRDEMNAYIGYLRNRGDTDA